MVNKIDIKEISEWGVNISKWCSDRANEWCDVFVNYSTSKYIGRSDSEKWTYASELSSESVLMV